MSSQHTQTSDSSHSTSRRAILKTFAGGAAGAAFAAAGWAVTSAAPRPAVELGSAPATRVPVKLVVIFNEPEDAELFEGYYLTTHLPLARAMPNCASLETAVAVGGAAGEKAAFYRIDTMTFNSEAALVSCVASAAGQAALADVANFATGGATATIVHDIQSFQGAVQAGPSSDVKLPQRYEQRRMD